GHRCRHRRRHLPRGVERDRPRAPARARRADVHRRGDVPRPAHARRGPRGPRRDDRGRAGAVPRAPLHARPGAGRAQRPHALCLAHRAGGRRPDRDRDRLRRRRARRQAGGRHRLPRAL
ncbi:MAG: hypothetical protein AVDCRST_MAG85-1165, partial [uncultured Solirubrobacteraceae bacterium]